MCSQANGEGILVRILSSLHPIPTERELVSEYKFLSFLDVWTTVLDGACSILLMYQLKISPVYFLNFMTIFFGPFCASSLLPPMGHQMYSLRGHLPKRNAKHRTQNEMNSKLIWRKQERESGWKRVKEKHNKRRHIILICVAVLPIFLVCTPLFQLYSDV